MTSDAQPPRTLPYDPDPEDVFEFSASAIKTWRGCGQKYGYGYVAGIKAPGGAGAQRGTEIHSQLEAWLLKAAVPSDATAKRLLPLLPLPTHPGLLVEHPFRVLFPQGAARGFIDLLIPDPDLKKMPPGPWTSGTPIIVDHKSTSRIDFALTPEELRTDPQAILYGVEARRIVGRARGVRVVDVPEVDLSWNYGSTKTKETRPVRMRQSLAILEDGLGPLLETAQEMAAAVALGVDRIADLPYDLRECDRFGGCPHRAYCKAHQTYALTGYALETGSDRNESVRPASEAANPEQPKRMNMNVMNKLRALGQQPSKPPPPLETEAPATESGSTAVTPEPTLPKPDTSGLSTPIPAGTSPVNPPDAAPNVSPTDPPPPTTASEPAKRKPGRPAKAKPATVVVPAQHPVVITAEPIEAEFEAVSVQTRGKYLTDEEAEAELKNLAAQALAGGRYVLAAQATNTLIALRSGT